MNKPPGLPAMGDESYPSWSDAEVSERISRTQRFSRIWIGVFVLILLLASTVVQVGGAVVGQGQLGVETRVKQITHPSGGVIKAILVHDGQKVEAGQLLLQLDNSVSGTNAMLTDETVEHLMAQHARLSVEAAGGATLEFPPALLANPSASAQAAVASERQLFLIRQGERSSMRSQLQQRIQQQSEQIRGYEAQISALLKQKALIEPERTGVKELWDKGLVTINRLNQLERTAVDFDGTIGSLRAQIAQTRAQIAETRQQMISSDQSARSEAGAQLEQVNIALNDQRVKSASATDQFKRSEIRAPYAGTIDKLIVTTVGGVIEPSKVLMEIIPTNEALLVEGTINPADIDRVRVGQTARVRLTAFSAPTTPEISGKVEFVSADKATNPTTGASFYRVHVRMDKSEIAGQKIELKPGMPTELFISTGNRSLISYIFKPLRDQFERAFRD